MNVKIPNNVEDIFKSVFQIASFDVVPTEYFYEGIVSLSYPPLVIVKNEEMCELYDIDRYEYDEDMQECEDPIEMEDDQDESIE